MPPGPLFTQSSLTPIGTDFPTKKPFILFFFQFCALNLSPLTTTAHY